MKNYIFLVPVKSVLGSSIIHYCRGMILWQLRKMLTVVALYRTKRKNKNLSLKRFTDEKDPLLLYEISENAQYVFKSSSSKVHIANLMFKDSGHFLCKEYGYFDGKQGSTNCQHLLQSSKKTNSTRHDGVFTRKLSTR